MKNTSLPIVEFYGDRNRPKPSREEMYIPDRENIKLIWIPGASHSLPTEKPREVAEGMIEFLRDR